MRTPEPPPLDGDLEALLRRLRLPHIRRAAPEVIATARAQRWEPAEVLKALFVEELAGLESLTDGLAEVIHGLVAVELLEAGAVGIVEAGVEEEVGERLHEVFEIEGGGEVAGEFRVADALHIAPLFIVVGWREGRG